MTTTFTIIGAWAGMALALAAWEYNEVRRHRKDFAVDALLCTAIGAVLASGTTYAFF